MNKNKYTLRYLPMFYDDVYAVIDYIKFELKNPKAALNLVNKIENKIMKRLPICEEFEIYQTKIKTKYPYYRIYVENFVIYYVVIDNKIMEVRRLLYKRQDITKFIV